MMLTVPSFSVAGLNYRIRATETSVSCSCPDFHKTRAKFAPTPWSADDQVCKHIRRHREAIQHLVIESDPLVVVIERTENSAFRYHLALWWKGQMITVGTAMYLHWATSRNAVANNLVGIRQFTGDVLSVRVVDLTGDSVLAPVLEEVA